MRTLRPLKRPGSSLSINKVLEDVVEYLEQNKEHYLIVDQGKLFEMLTDCRKVLQAYKDLNDNKELQWAPGDKVKYLAIFPRKLHQTLIGETDDNTNAMQWKDYQDYFARDSTKGTYENLMPELKKLHGSWDVSR